MGEMGGEETGERGQGPEAVAGERQGVQRWQRAGHTAAVAAALVCSWDWSQSCSSYLTPLLPYINSKMRALPSPETE